jgi:hypothetical protein
MAHPARTRNFLQITRFQNSGDSLLNSEAFYTSGIAQELSELSSYFRSIAEGQYQVQGIEIKQNHEQAVEPECNASAILEARLQRRQ